MLKLSFSEYSILISYTLALFIVWVIFFKINFINIRTIDKKNDSVVKPFLNKTLNVYTYLVINLYILLFLIISVYIFKGYNYLFWWNHFKLNNFNLSLILIFYIINILYLIVCNTLIINKGTYKSDYFFALLNLSIILPLILLVNNLFTFFFFLEVNSAIIFFKFITTNCWSSNTNKLFYKKSTPKNYVNMLFFQYWSAFFSSVLLVYIIISYIYIRGYKLVLC